MEITKIFIHLYLYLSIYSVCLCVLFYWIFKFIFYDKFIECKNITAIAKINKSYISKIWKCRKYLIKLKYRPIWIIYKYFLRTTTTTQRHEQHFCDKKCNGKKWLYKKMDFTSLFKAVLFLYIVKGEYEFSFIKHKSNIWDFSYLVFSLKKRPKGVSTLKKVQICKHGLLKILLI